MKKQVEKQIKLNQLPKTTKKAKKRLGRGYGSGKGGHTVGRGSKGQKARSKVPLIFAGTKTRKSLIKRLPLWRGKGKLKSFKLRPLVVNLKYLQLFAQGETVDLKSLVKKGIVKSKEAEKLGVKILGEGELKVALTVKLPCSQGAAKKIIKAGGKVLQKKKVKATTKKAVKKVAKKVAKEEKAAAGKKKVAKKEVQEKKGKKKRKKK